MGERETSYVWGLSLTAIVIGLVGCFGAASLVKECRRLHADIVQAHYEIRELKADKCRCKPAPTPAPCCKADECRKELAQVDARFGDVWDEMVEVQEQLAKVKPCGCGPVKECCCEPSKPCACSDKPACECKSATPKLQQAAPACGRRARR